ncbi:MAG: hypothetical protein V4487_02620 [Chlamydiota bacterium]
MIDRLDNDTFSVVKRFLDVDSSIQCSTCNKRLDSLFQDPLSQKRIWEEKKKDDENLRKIATDLLDLMSGYWGDRDLQNDLLLHLFDRAGLNFKTNDFIHFFKSLNADQIRDFLNKPKVIDVLSKAAFAIKISKKISDLPRILGKMKNIMVIDFYGNNADSLSTFRGFNQLPRLKAIRLVSIGPWSKLENDSFEIQFNYDPYSSKVDTFPALAATVSKAYKDHLQYEINMKTLQKNRFREVALIIIPTLFLSFVGIL